MNHQFAFLQLSHDDLKEMYFSLLRQWILECTLRQERGLEPVMPPPLLDRLEALLQLKEEEAHQLFHAVEDELWEYSWCTFTDEWAWYRAHQDVTKELGAETKRTDQHHLDALIQKRYEDGFETYLAEVDMHDETTVQEKKRARQPKK